MHIKSALLAVALLPVFAVAQTSQTAAPTVAEAQAFMDKAEADLLALTNEAGRAQWVQETFITDDTEAIAAKANERLLNRTNQLVIASRRFKGMKLP
ncbi:MAG TPA: M2 family metallopeptidase, partial [Edaphobacter sp.]